MPWTVKDVDRFKKNLTPKQKRQWVAVANEVYDRCMEDGGSDETCAPKAIRQANGVIGVRKVGHEEETYTPFHLTTNNYMVRTEVHQGRSHIVVPVIMMVEGVHNGSHGPMLHLAEELGKYPSAWNGIPVSVQHPEEEGVHVSANDPSIIDRQTVGRVFNTKMENGKLKAEAWLDEEAVTRISPEVLDYIRKSAPLEVSVGVFTDEELTPGEWEGEEYQAIARNHRPDHLALLPGGIGACSWADGCGVRVNEKGGESELTIQSGTPEAHETLKTPKQLVGEGFSLSINRLSYQDISIKIQEKLDKMDDDEKLHFLDQCYEGYFIYRIGKRGDLPPGFPMAPEGELYRRDYEVKENESVEFLGEPIAVTKRVEYVALENSEGVETMAKKDKEVTPCCPEKVELLIQNELTHFGEDDREWLETLSEEQLAKLEPMVQETTPVKEGDEKDKGVDMEAARQELLKMSQEQAVKVLEEKLTDPDQFLALLPKETREQMEHGLKLYKAHREGIIAKILEFNEAFSAEELNEKPTAELEKLSTFVKAKSDFSLLGGLKTQGSKEEKLLPPGMEQ